MPDQRFGTNTPFHEELRQRIFDQKQGGLGYLRLNKLSSRRIATFGFGINYVASGHMRLEYLRATVKIDTKRGLGSVEIRYHVNVLSTTENISTTGCPGRSR